MSNESNHELRELRRRAKLIDAICGRGWDAPSATNLERANAYLLEAPELAREDFVLACATGELERVRQALAADATLATRELEPRGWQPLVYVAFSTLARVKDERARRITEIGKLLLQHGASANCHYVARIEGHAERHPFPVLFGCVHVSDNLQLAAALLEAGADPNDNETLYHAAERFDLEVLDLLHRFGLKPEWLSYCILHKIDFGHVAGVRWFLEHGADPNVAHPNGHHALHWAIMRPGPRAMAELLLEHGADPNLTTKAGHTALDLAERWHGRIDLVPALEARGGTRTARTALDEIVVAAAHGDEARARALLAQHPDAVSTRGDENRALVPAFAETGNARGASVLIRLGFDAAATSWEGMTAVHWAACHGTPAWVRELLAAGAPILDLPRVRTPLHTALYQHWFQSGPGANDYAGVVRVLLEAGMPIPENLKPSGDPELDALVGIGASRDRQQQEG